MKKELQPKIYTEAVVKCACGNTFTTISTQPTISVEICSACHPFYTGQRRFVDTERRIDKFTKRQKLAEETKTKTLAAKKAKAEKKKAPVVTKAKTVREILEEIKTQEAI
jgi:large subunit ribosomal protein L31